LYLNTNFFTTKNKIKRKSLSKGTSYGRSSTVKRHSKGTKKRIINHTLNGLM